MRPGNFAIVTNGDMSLDVISSIIPLEQDFGACIQAVFTGSPNGTFKLQISNDMGTGIDGTGVVNWTDYTGSSVPISVAGDYSWDITVTNAKWMRLVYTVISGFGTLNARANVKGL